ncbi:hypothetical protein [Streptomyces sp. NPDC002785]|uniref:zinc finger domain-containing protein n=1 Tax=Streptomyces sp. NPDC002785 TaxID=3154543 RepID=UPI0033343283
MTQQESWGYWRPQLKSGQLTELTKSWFRRVECTACGAVVGRACRSAGGYPTNHHKARRAAAGAPPYKEWRAQGLINTPEPRPATALTQAAQAAQQEFRVDQPLGDAVALVRRFLADRAGQETVSEEVLDHYDQEVRALLLARGPEGSTEIVTVLAGQLASLLKGANPKAPDAAYTEAVTKQISYARAHQRLERLLSDLESEQATPED